jgi:hypothetical protein
MSQPGVIIAAKQSRLGSPTAHVRCVKATATPFSTTARAQNNPKRRLSGRHAHTLLSGRHTHTKAPYKNDVLWRVPRTLKHPGRSRTAADLRECEPCGVRSHCRYAPPLIQFIPELLTYSLRVPPAAPPPHDGAISMSRGGAAGGGAGATSKKA